MKPAMFLALSVSVATLALAACSGEPGEADQSATVATPAERVIPAEHDTPAVNSTPQAMETIPEQFLGIWDFVDGTCDPASDLRMDIRPAEIEFYESIGKVTSVTLENPQTAVVALDMTGEGERWQITNRFVLSDGDAILTPLEAEGDPEYEPLPRKRCKS